MRKLTLVLGFLITTIATFGQGSNAFPFRSNVDIFGDLVVRDTVFVDSTIVMRVFDGISQPIFLTVDSNGVVDTASFITQGRFDSLVVNGKVNFGGLASQNKIITSLPSGNLDTSLVDVGECCRALWDSTGTAVHFKDQTWSLGIGTTTPTRKVEIVGDILFTTPKFYPGGSPTDSSYYQYSYNDTGLLLRRFNERVLGNDSTIVSLFGGVTGEGLNCNKIAPLDSATTTSLGAASLPYGRLYVIGITSYGGASIGGGLSVSGSQINFNSLPTDTIGLVPGDIWRDTTNLVNGSAPLYIKQ